jgi:SsrA-binding protein
MAKSNPKPVDPDAPITVCRNRKASHEYDLLDRLDCGVALVGSEVKSIRAGKISIEEAYVKVRDGEVWLIGCDIAEYPQASYLNHDPRRIRKLLLRKRELKKFADGSAQKGLTLIPIEVFLKRGFVKVTIALAKGKKLYDKREKLKARVDNREVRNAKMVNVQNPRRSSGN